MKGNVNAKIYTEEKDKKEVLPPEVIEALIRAEEQIEKGEVIDAKEVFAEWKEKYGI